MNIQSFLCFGVSCYRPTQPCDCQQESIPHHTQQWAVKRLWKDSILCVSFSCGARLIHAEYICRAFLPIWFKWTSFIAIGTSSLAANSPIIWDVSTFTTAFNTSLPTFASRASYWRLKSLERNFSNYLITVHPVVAPLSNTSLVFRDVWVHWYHYGTRIRK